MTLAARIPAMRQRMASPAWWPLGVVDLLEAAAVELDDAHGSFVGSGEAGRTLPSRRAGSGGKSANRAALRPRPFRAPRASSREEARSRAAARRPRRACGPRDWQSCVKPRGAPAVVWSRRRKPGRRLLDLEEVVGEDAVGRPEGLRQLDRSRLLNAEREARPAPDLGERAGNAVASRAGPSRRSATWILAPPST